MLNVEFQRDFDAERILEEGKEEGKLEGKLEGKREAAINALSKGASTEFVADITGLPIDEIDEMKKILQS
jgi:predicted transposase/invertase (TIGR01784 family)